MISVPEPLPDDPAALKQLLAEVLSSAQKLAKDKDGQIEHLREQNALLIQRKRSINPVLADGVVFRKQLALASSSTATALRSLRRC